MAKLTANGETEVARWRLGDSRNNTDLGQMVLTSGGRILRKGTVQGDGWKVAARARKGATVTPSSLEARYVGLGYRLERVHGAG